MQNPLKLLSSHFEAALRAGSDAFEPLDDPSLRGKCRAFIDDLPLPAYAIKADGSVTILGGA